jgi:hypothetical protein
VVLGNILLEAIAKGEGLDFTLSNNLLEALTKGKALIFKAYLY